MQSFVALFAGVMGLEGLLRRPGPSTDRAPPPYAAAAIGVGVGLISALSSTGGPLILVPLMLMIGTAPPRAIGLAQAVQIPIAIAASGAAATLGVLDLTLAVPLAIGLAFGSAVGVRAFHRFTPSRLRTAACLILVSTSIVIAIRLLAAGR